MTAIAWIVVALVAAGTLAFGAVYPWAYVPLLLSAAAIGLAGIHRRGVLSHLRGVAATLVVLAAAGAVSLVPLPADVVSTISPASAAYRAAHDLAFADGANVVPLSIDPAATRTAVLALLALGLYMVGLPALLDGKAIRAIPAALVVVALPIAVFGIYTREYNNGLIYGFWPPVDGGGANQAGPFVNRNHFGGWMLMSECILIGALLGHVERAGVARRVRERGLVAWLGSSAANRVVLAAITVLVPLVAIVWSMSRSAMISLVVALSLFAWTAAGRTAMSPVRRGATLATLAVMLLAGIAWRGPAELADWFQDERNLLGRFDAWRDALDVARAFPLAGTGLNTFGDAMLLYQRHNPGFHMAQAHNDYVQLLAEGGLLVAVAAGAAAVVLARTIGRTLAAARVESRGYWIRAGAVVGMAAVAVQEVVEFSLQIPANALLFSTLAAIALTPPARSAAPGAHDTIPPSGLPRAPLP